MKLRAIVLLAVVSSAWPLCMASRAQDISREARVEGKIVDLEKRILELEFSKGAPKPALGPPLPANEPAAPADSCIVGHVGIPLAVNRFKDGFIVNSADDRHQLRITGQVQADWRVYPQAGDSTDIDTLLVRRARLGIEATMFDFYEFRLLPEWGNNRATIQDAFVNVHYWDQLQFQAGKFKEPVSYEQLIQDRFVPTLERSIIDQIVPARDVGLMIHGRKVLNNHFDYAIGVFNGEPNADLDTNKLRDAAGRIAWRPFVSFSESRWLQPWQVGVSGTIGKEEEPLNLNGSATLRTPGNIPWLTFNKDVRADGIRSRITPEVSFILDSFGFAAQYLRMDQEMRAGGSDLVQNIRFQGYYFLTTYLLTGETRTTYSAAVVPRRPYAPLSPFANPGAWEVLARLSHLQVDPSIFQPDRINNLARARGNSDGATELTIGFNWYLNAFVRMQFNWEHAWYAQPILLGPPNRFFSQTDAVLMRVQIIF